MGEKTEIPWTDSSWNPWTACTKVSPGCQHCYMFREKTRWGKDPTKVTRSSPPTFKAPLKWKEPRMIFVCSWSDFFHVDADSWRNEAWEIMRKAPQHTYQVLTKRPERIISCTPPDILKTVPHLWLGVTAENQEFADKRLPALREAPPSEVRFVSCEPLLGPLDLTPYISWLQWIIVGGESGSGCRPMDPAWAISIKNQCQAGKVPFFFKQHGGTRKCTCHHAYGCCLLEGALYKGLPLKP